MFITKDKAFVCGKTQAQDIYVDGNRIGDVGNLVIKDRKMMSSDGILVIIATIDSSKAKILSKPIITTRGFVLVNENAELIKKIEDVSNNIITNKLKEENYNYNDMKYAVVSGTSSFIRNETGRNPIIISMITDIKDLIK